MSKCFICGTKDRDSIEEIKEDWVCQDCCENNPELLFRGEYDDC
jgi:hypothetical protein